LGSNWKRLFAVDPLSIKLVNFLIFHDFFDCVLRDESDKTEASRPLSVLVNHDDALMNLTILSKIVVQLLSGNIMLKTSNKDLVCSTDLILVVLRISFILIQHLLTRIASDSILSWLTLSLRWSFSSSLLKLGLFFYW